jgi:hypothetical protein
MSFKSWHSLLPTPEADILLCVGLPAIYASSRAHLNAIRVTNQPAENAIAERGIAYRFVLSNIRPSSFGRLGLKTKKPFGQPSRGVFRLTLNHSLPPNALSLAKSSSDGEIFCLRMFAHLEPARHETVRLCLL